VAITALLCLGVMSCGLLWPSYEYPSWTKSTGSRTTSLKLDPCKDGTVKIGTQVWQKCNLNVDPGTGKSMCYKNDSENCAKYGRLYDWATAMNLPSSCNESNCASQVSAKHRGLCPSGWHIPNDADWNKLINYVGGISEAGKYLKVKGWDGRDPYGFSARPGGGYGYARSGGSFVFGAEGLWWSASEYDSYSAYNRHMGATTAVFNDEGNSKSSLYSVRCLQD